MAENRLQFGVFRVVRPIIGQRHEFVVVVIALNGVVCIRIQAGKSEVAGTSNDNDFIELVQKRVCQRDFSNQSRQGVFRVAVVGILCQFSGNSVEFFKILFPVREIVRVGCNKVVNQPSAGIDRVKRDVAVVGSRLVMNARRLDKRVVLSAAKPQYWDDSQKE